MPGTIQWNNADLRYPKGLTKMFTKFPYISDSTCQNKANGPFHTLIISGWREYFRCSYKINRPCQCLISKIPRRRESIRQPSSCVLIEMIPRDRINSIHDFLSAFMWPFPPLLDRFILLNILWKMWKKNHFFSVMLRFESHEFIFLKITVAACSDCIPLQLYLALILFSKKPHAFFPIPTLLSRLTMGWSSFGFWPEPRKYHGGSMT